MEQNLTSRNFEDKLREHFEVEKETAEQIFHKLTLCIFQQQMDTNDLYVLAKLLPEDNLVKLISYYDGDTVRLPSKKEYRETYILVVVFFLKEIQKKTWSEIKQILGLKATDEISTISIGKKLISVKKEFVDQLLKLGKKNDDLSSIKDTLKDLQKRVKLRDQKND